MSCPGCGAPLEPRCPYCGREGPKQRYQWIVDEYRPTFSDSGEPLLSATVLSPDYVERLQFQTAQGLFRFEEAKLERRDA